MVDGWGKGRLGECGGRGRWCREERVFDCGLVVAEPQKIAPLSRFPLSPDGGSGPAGIRVNGVRRRVASPERGSIGTRLPGPCNVAKNRSIVRFVGQSGAAGRLRPARPSARDRHLVSVILRTSVFPSSGRVFETQRFGGYGGSRPRRPLCGFEDSSAAEATVAARRERRPLPRET